MENPCDCEGQPAPAPTAGEGDIQKEYKEEKMRMGTVKASMTKSLKRLEGANQESSDLVRGQLRSRNISMQSRRITGR